MTDQFVLQHDLDQISPVQPVKWTQATVLWCYGLIQVREPKDVFIKQL